MIYKIVDGVSIALSDEEIAALQSDVPPFDIQSEAVRNQRNRLLQETDWMALSDVTMPAEMQSYRQALRDITDQEGFPYSLTWPTKP